MGTAAQSDRNGLRGKNPSEEKDDSNSKRRRGDHERLNWQQELSGNTYPGRGIVLGKSEDGARW